MRHHSFPSAAVLGAFLVLASACGSTDANESSLLDTASTDPPPTVVAAADPVVDSATLENGVAADVAVTSTLAPTTTTSLPTAEECAASVPLEIRVGQLMFPLATQADLPFATELVAAGKIGGVVMIGNPNAAIADGIAAMQAQSLLGPAIVAVDEEGGRVQRLASLTSSIPSAGKVASDLTPAEARTLAESHASAIGALGFTMNLAPVVDLNNGSFIGNRSFGADPELVTEFAFATAEGILAAGLTPVVKHFPGHGRGIDSHTGLPTLPDLEVLRADDLIPFVRAVERGDLPIMIGHLVVPGLTNGKPATLSPEAIDGLLRTELGFDGLVMTDAFNMDAIADTTSNADAAEQAIGAGVDLVMLGALTDVDVTVAQVVAAVASGRVSEETVTASFLRVLDTRGLTICALPEDLRPKIGCEQTQGGC